MTKDKESTPNQQLKFRISGLYVKDISFENPLAPGIFIQQVEKRPEMNVGIDVNAGKLKDNAYEVALRIHAKAESADKKAFFLVEMVYAGLFVINPEIPATEHERLLFVDRAAAIFPFARRLISDLVQEGGFPPLLLEPLDFAGLYQSKRNKAA